MPDPIPTNMPPLATLCPWIDKISGVAITVWGDVVADRFVFGSTTRVSREAPALVLHKEGEEIRPGGAGNAMMNAAALGAEVTAVGFLGADGIGRSLRGMLEAGGVRTDHLVERADAATPVKTRVMAGGFHTARQQILRIDADPPWPASDEYRATLRAALAAAVADSRGLLLSDYGMGSACPLDFAAARADLQERGVLVVADSRHALVSYAGVTVVTPNEEEVEEALDVPHGQLDGALDDAGARLLEALACEAVLVTRGSRGMSLFQRDGDSVHLPIHGSDQIADVTGAGDAVIAAFTATRLAGASVVEAARISNVAAGLAVMKRGTATVPAAELRAALEAGA